MSNTFADSIVFCLEGAINTINEEIELLSDPERIHLIEYSIEDLKNQIDLLKMDIKFIRESEGLNKGAGK